ncbi:MAG: AAA family ATPase, partial [Myxococcaceae bacterium]|nr:AAA family ATPase [Myxococcaceae bacterium]
EKRILVVAGAGGVGKTTTAAALGLQAALLGRRVLVCTIDPSRRLATSLGLEDLPAVPHRLELGSEGLGEMWAMTLDTKRTFDALVERYASGEAARRRILDNRFYQHVSSALAGSHEYMAMEKLLELSADDDFDLIVLDTPPTRHALDFLEAPDRLMGFLDTSVLRWVLKPYFVAGRLTLKVATRTGALALGLADRLLGLRFLEDLSEFFLAFDGMYDGFKQRAAQVHALLRGQTTGFVLVAAPAPGPVQEAVFFRRRLAAAQMPFLVYVVNRVHPDPGATVEHEGGGRAEVSPSFREALLRVFEEQRRLAAADRRHVALLRDEGDPVLVVPEREGDVHDLRGLRDVARSLHPEERPAPARGPRAVVRGRRRRPA